MAYKRIEEVVQRWIDVTEGREQEFFENNCTPVRGGRLFSYGSHFELARPLRSRSGKVEAYVLNGDQWTGGGWGHATNNQQGLLRQKLQDRTKVIIPFSALDQAGINLDTIRIIDILADRSETRKHHSTTAPEGSQWRGKPIMENRPRTEEEIALLRRHHHIQDGAETPYWMTRSTYVQVGTKHVLHTSWRKWSQEITVTWNEDHTARSYDWKTYHHWLGESLIRARVDWRDAEQKTHHRWAYFLSGFDHQEPAPLYFLCELPRGSKPATVADAYEILKPEPVKLAEQMGRTVIRQGDIFAVPAPTLDRRTLQKMGAAFEKRSDRVRGKVSAELLNTNHRATEVARLPNGLTIARGCLYHDPSGRRPDHIRRKIADGQGWHIIIKNTVPIGRR